MTTKNRFGLLAAMAIIILGSAALNTSSACANDGDMSNEGQGDENSVVFASPSMNIFCEYSGMEQAFACERIKPTSLGAGLGAGAVEKFTESRALKSSFQDWGTGAFVLPYGKTWKPNGNANGLSCTSLKTGMRCKDNSGGFVLSKKGLKIF